MDKSFNTTESLIAKIKELEKENAYLKKLVKDAGIVCGPESINKVFETESDYGELPIGFRQWVVHNYTFCRERSMAVTVKGEKTMKQKWILIMTAMLVLATALGGCGNTPAAQQAQDSEKTSQKSVEQAQTTPEANADAEAIDKAKAQEIALAHAGVKAADATITKTMIDYDDGRQVYEIEWYADGAKYDYEIDAATGEVIKSDYESKTLVGSGNSATLSETDAKKTAIARVSGATESDIYEWKLDYDDGHPEYEGTIIYGGSEYEFTIDAATGAITEWEAEELNN